MRGLYTDAPCLTIHLISPNPFPPTAQEAFRSIRVYGFPNTRVLVRHGITEPRGVWPPQKQVHNIQNAVLSINRDSGGGACTKS